MTVRMAIAVYVALGAVAILSGSPDAQAQTRIAVEDPGNTPVDDDGKWGALPEGGIAVPGDDCIWIGKMNSMVEDRIKSVSVRVTFGENDGVPFARDAKGYLAGTPPTEATRVLGITWAQGSSLNERVYKFTLVPQPDWEWLKLCNIVSSEAMEITAASIQTICYKRIETTNKWELKGGWHLDGGSGLELTELTIFPDSDELDIYTAPEFDPPGDTGPWYWEHVDVDPFTENSMPMGIRIWTDGVGIGEGESQQYSLGIPLVQNTGGGFTYYTRDYYTDELHGYTLLGSTTIPAVSEWGLIVMTLLLLTAGTVVFGRRRRPVAA